jgi:hypothetical protein
MRGSTWQLVAAFLLLVTRAGADVSPTDRSLARELFEQGRKLMAKKRYPEACAKLAESQKLDPAPGTLLNLAVCHEAEGKTATAWSEYNDALTLARRDGRDDRVELATSRLAKLEPRLSRLTIEIEASARIAGLDVRLDGSRIGEAAWGTAVPVDPGTHVVEATAPNRRSWRIEVSLGGDADRKTVRIPLLAERPLAPASPSRRAAVGTSEPTRDEEDGATQRAVGYIVGGLGLASIGVGSYFGVTAFSHWDQRNAHCTDAGCDPDGVAAGRDAERAATIANIGIGIGVVATAVGAYLVLSAGSSEPRATAAATATGDGRGMLVRYRATF